MSLKKFDEFINENDSTYINWEEIEEACANTPDLADCVPQNIRQWETFIKQYERATDLINRKWEPHYDWETRDEFNQAVNEQFYFDKGYKNSVYECFKDISLTHREIFKNVEWTNIAFAYKFILWDLYIAHLGQNFLVLRHLSNKSFPKKIGGDFSCSNSQVFSLKDFPEYVGGNFCCDHNNLSSLIGGPKYVGGHFDCSDNRLISLEGCPEYVGGMFMCKNNYFELPDKFFGTELPKYINL